MAATARLTVRVTPRAGAARVGPYQGDILQVRVTRSPVDGEANEAARLLIARALGVPRSTVTLVAGARSRTKRFAIDGLSPAELKARLAVLGD